MGIKEATKTTRKEERRFEIRKQRKNKKKE